ncbi:MAG: hypothetical protein D6796_09325 [Caldilineae bacterium]|nr:MAG: hypothetical protein D6796_09325 [Caldilineae bacterium]
MYLLVAALALGLRLAYLAHYALNDAEASQALAALSIYHGETPAGGYSPLMASLVSATFVLFGDADWATRLPSALLGLVLVMLPFGLRRQLGRRGALAASALLAVSASALFWSRTLSGDAATATGMLLLLVGGTRWLGEGETGGLYGAAGGLALLLTGAPSGFTALATLLASLAMLAFTVRGAQAAVQSRLAAGERAVRNAGYLFGGLLLLLATAGLFNLSGLAAVSDLLTRWLESFGLQPRPGAAYPAILLLFFYEPLLLFFGVVGLGAAVGSRRPLDWLLAVWAALAITLDLLMGGRSGGQVLVVLVPLSLLAGRQIGSLWEGLQTRARLDGEGLFIAIGLMVSTFIYISGMSWARCTAAQAGCGTAWVLPLAGALLIGGLAVIFGMWYGAGTAWRGLGAVLLVTLGCLSVGASWRLSFGPPAHLPFQPMTALPASTRFRTLQLDLQRQSAERVGDRHEIEMAVVGVDTPMLRWGLRRFERVRFVGSFAETGDEPILLARPDAGQPVGRRYVGQEYALIAHWSLDLLNGKEWVRWYVYRYLPNHKPGSDQLVMWVRVGGRGER